jgi:hypothetical protein
MTAQTVETITNPNGSRQYNVGEFNYPSVTTIRDATESKDKQANLRKWQHKMDRINGNGSANRYAADRAQEGKDIHQQIADYIKGETSELPNSPYLNKAGSMLRLFRQTHWHVEYFLAHPHPQGYAGTLDLIAPFEDTITVFDWTTSKRPKIKAWLSKKFIQCTAYAIAWEKNFHQKPSQVGVIVLTAKGMQLFTDPTEKWEQDWRDRLHLFYERELWKDLGLNIIAG